MTINLWQAENRNIKAKMNDKTTIEGYVLSCSDEDETENGELMLYIENDNGIFAHYKNEFSRIEFTDPISDELMVMDSRETDEQLDMVQLAYHSMSMEKEKRYVLENCDGLSKFRTIDFFETADEAVKYADKNWKKMQETKEVQYKMALEQPGHYLEPVEKYEKSKGAVFKVYKIDATDEEIKKKFYTEDFPSFEEYEIDCIKNYIS